MPFLLDSLIGIGSIAYVLFVFSSSECLGRLTVQNRWMLFPLSLGRSYSKSCGTVCVEWLSHLVLVLKREKTNRLISFFRAEPEAKGFYTYWIRHDWDCPIWMAATWFRTRICVKEACQPLRTENMDDVGGRIQVVPSVGICLHSSIQFNQPSISSSKWQSRLRQN